MTKSEDTNHNVAKVQSDEGLHCLPMSVCRKNKYNTVAIYISIENTPNKISNWPPYMCTIV